jgi:hypothetical protein
MKLFSLARSRFLHFLISPSIYSGFFLFSTATAEKSSSSLMVEVIGGDLTVILDYLCFKTLHLSTDHLRAPFKFQLFHNFTLQSVLERKIIPKQGSNHSRRA